MTSITKQAMGENGKESREAPAHSRDSALYDELFDEIAEIINENFMLEVEASIRKTQ